jgi:hypothetical protein
MSIGNFWPAGIFFLGNGDDVFDSTLEPGWTNRSWVFGGDGDDSITASAVPPTIESHLLASGDDGDDTIRLEASNSLALGGRGDDMLTAIGGLGNYLDGGPGEDLLISFGGGSGMGPGNTLSGGFGTDAFRFTNAGNLVVTRDAGQDGRVSDGDVFLGPMDVITDYRRGETIELRSFEGPDEVPPYEQVEEVALITDPLSADRFRPVVGDGEFALFRGHFSGDNTFIVAQHGRDLLVVYDAFNGQDDEIAQGSLVLRGFTDESGVLIA